MRSIKLIVSFVFMFVLMLSANARVRSSHNVTFSHENISSNIFSSEKQTPIFSNDVPVDIDLLTDIEENEDKDEKEKWLSANLTSFIFGIKRKYTSGQSSIRYRSTQKISTVPQYILFETFLI